jgi:hypothetical protein
MSKKVWKKNISGKDLPSSSSSWLTRRGGDGHVEIFIILMYLISNPRGGQGVVQAWWLTLRIKNVKRDFGVSKKNQQGHMIFSDLELTWRNLHKTTPAAACRGLWILNVLNNQPEIAYASIHMVFMNAITVILRFSSIVFYIDCWKLPSAHFGIEDIAELGAANVSTSPTPQNMSFVVSIISIIVSIPLSTVTPHLQAQCCTTTRSTPHVFQTL